MRLLEGKRGHGIAVAFMVLIPLIFFWQMIVAGQEPMAPDTQAVKPLGKWALATEADLDQMPLWCNGIFSGMPSHGSFIYTPSSSFDLLRDLRLLFRDNRGIRYFLSLLVGALSLYTLLILRRKAPMCALAGAVIFSMTPYFLGLIAAGHSTKLHALCLLPAVWLALELLLARRTLFAAGLLSATIALQLWTNHPQIAYYTLFLGALYLIGVLIFDRPATWQGRGLWIGLVLGVLALVLAVGLIMDPYASVLEYTPHSIRGGTGELQGAGESAGGSGWDYATAWSYPVKELVCFIFPAWFGLEGVTYWGDLPMTQSTHYLGVTALLLAALALMLTTGRRRWLLLFLSTVVLLIGFGRNLPILFKPMYELMPMFNRFRVPAMIYSTLPLMTGLLAAEGLQLLLDESLWAKFKPVVAKREKPVQKQAGASQKRSGSTKSASGSPTDFPGGLTGSMLKHWQKITISCTVLLLLWLFGGGAFTDSMRHSGAFIKDSEASQWGARYVEPLTTQSLDQLANTPGFPSQLVDLITRRIDVLRSSVLTGLLFITLVVLVIELRRRGVLKGEAAVMVAVLLIVADLWVINLKFYHPAPRAQTEAVLIPDPVSRWLVNQPGDFRVAPLTRQDYSSNRFAAFGLQSLGGYQPAKLRLYQDLLESNVLFAPAVFSMLNARYLLMDSDMSDAGLPLATTISGGGQGGQVTYIHENPDVLPRAWFVNNLRLSEDAPTLITHMSTPEFTPATTAWVYEDELARLQAAAPSVTPDTALSPGIVTDLQYGSHRLSAKVSVNGPDAGLLIFSEIFYPPGWEATIDGEAGQIYRVNHILRAMIISAGEHEVEMYAVSHAREWGRMISLICAALVGLLIGGGWWIGRRSAF